MGEQVVPLQGLWHMMAMAGCSFARTHGTVRAQGSPCPATLDVPQRTSQEQSIFSTFRQNGVKPQLPRSLEDRRERWRKLFKVTEMAKQFCSRQRVSLGTHCPGEPKSGMDCSSDIKLRKQKCLEG